MFKVIFLGVIFFSSFSYAKDPFNVFVKHEFNGTDSITGIGATATIAATNNMLKGEFVSSINYAEVYDETGLSHEFVSLDTAVRLGIYNQVFIYIEAGVDVFEMFLNENRDDDNFDDSKENNDIDGYAGLGAGFNAKNMRVEGVVKARQIDGDTWDIDKQIFYGLQFSLFF